MPSKPCSAFADSLAPVVRATNCDLAHELAHLFLGHIGSDQKLNIPKRRPSTHNEREIEAESVAYLVSLRNVTPKSQVYLSSFVSGDKAIDDVDLYQVIRAAGQVELILGLCRSTQFPKRTRA